MFCVTATVDALHWAADVGGCVPCGFVCVRARAAPAGVGPPPCRRTFLRRPSLSSRKTSGPAASPAHQSRWPAAWATTRMEQLLPHRQTRMRAATTHLQPAASRARMAATALQRRRQQLRVATVLLAPQQAAPTPALLPHQLTGRPRRPRTALLQEALLAGTGSSRSRRRPLFPRPLRLLLAPADMAQPPLATAAAPARATRRARAMAATSSSRSPRSRSTSQSGPHPRHRYVVVLTDAVCRRVCECPAGAALVCTQSVPQHCMCIADTVQQKPGVVVGLSDNKPSVVQRAL